MTELEQAIAEAETFVETEHDTGEKHPRWLLELIEAARCMGMIEKLPDGSMLIKTKTEWIWSYGLGGRTTEGTLPLALEAALKKVGG